jgi:hypothetical protein
MSNMTFFNYSVPPLRRKQLNLEVQDLEGLWQVNFPLGKDTFYSTFYTCLDRACLMWSLLLILMFGTAQFFPVSWMLQASLWSALSLAGTVAMVSWTYCWVKKERLTWVLYSWVILMLLGLLLTDLGIFLGWGKVLANLCPLWLGMSGSLKTNLRLHLSQSSDRCNLKFISFRKRNLLAIAGCPGFW